MRSDLTFQGIAGVFQTQGCLEMIISRLSCGVSGLRMSFQDSDFLLVAATFMNNLVTCATAGSSLKNYYSP